MNFHLPYKLLLASALASFFLKSIFPDFGLISAHYRLFGLLLALAALFLGLWAKQTVLVSKTTLDPYGEPSAFVSTGPFRFSRNPMYLSYALVAFGIAGHAGSILSFLPPALYFIYLNSRVIPREEQKMRIAFGETYEAYSRKTRRWV